MTFEPECVLITTMKFFGKGSKKFYQTNKLIIDAIIQSGEIGDPDRSLPGSSCDVVRDKKNGIVAKRDRWGTQIPEKGVKDFIVPSVIHNNFCFQPLVEVNVDNRSNFLSKVEKILNMSLGEWYDTHNLPDEWIENVGIHEGKVKLIDW